MLADQLDYVVGVDSHRDSHALAVVAIPTGVVVFGTTVAADSGGYLEAFRVASERAPDRRAFAIEGTAMFDAGLSVLARASRASLRGWSTASRTPLWRQDRCARRDSSRTERADPEAWGGAAERRRARGVARVDGRPRRRGDREDRWPEPASRAASRRLPNLGGQAAGRRPIEQSRPAHQSGKLRLPLTRDSQPGCFRKGGGHASALRDPRRERARRAPDRGRRLGLSGGRTDGRG